MRTDKDDIPDYLKPRKKQGKWRTLAILGVGSAIFWSLVTVFAKPIVIDVAQLKQAIRFGGEPISQQPAKPQQPPAEALQGNDQDWIRSSEEVQQNAQTQRELQEWSQARAQEHYERQTSFSDANYVPQGARNVVPSTPIPREPTEVPPKKQEIVVVGKADPKLSDYCPYAKGSIEHRNCKAQINLNMRNR